MGPGAAGSGLSGGPSGSLLAFGYDFHRFFYPRLDGKSFVGRDFIIRIPVLSWNEFIIFAYETSDVTIRDTVDTVVATRTLPAGGFFATTGSPLAAGTVYQVTSTGDIALMSNSQNGYMSVPSRNGTDVGTEFLFGTRVWEEAAVAIFAYENSQVMGIDLVSGAAAFTRTLTANQFTYVGLGFQDFRRFKIQSTGRRKRGTQGLLTRIPDVCANFKIPCINGESSERIVPL